MVFIEETLNTKDYKGRKLTVAGVFKYPIFCRDVVTERETVLSENWTDQIKIATRVGYLLPVEAK